MDNELTNMKGALADSLRRGNKAIRTERALAIAESTEMVYSRKVQDIEMKLKRMRREQDSQLDLSPDNTMSLILAKDFDETAFIENDLDYAVKIREEEIRLDLAKKRYAYLFGGTEVEIAEDPVEQEA